MPGGRDRQGESFSGGNPGVPSGGRDGAGGDGFGVKRFLKKKKKTLATKDVLPKFNIGNVSGLGGKRDVTAIRVIERSSRSGRTGSPGRNRHGTASATGAVRSAAFITTSAGNQP